ncbi:hypothetical protein NEMIN01_2251 [Nematocida minor]|uniref:uncharacterized protein n=1 Tax=Nematocida minor TaxID=1912983 RepID=UPI0022207DA8|nr:uncharacterized protein NEMIN01_2251 [Nematocida minor]KAI5192865.1 hypothetical protein NEMIN01_2251 [Nematocida minor]
MDVNKMLQACLSIVGSDKVPKYNTKSEYYSMLVHIFQNHIKIEGGNHEDKINNQANAKILNIIRSKIYQYFIFNPHGMEVMSSFCAALQGEIDIDGTVKPKAISLIDELLKPNTLIYDRCYGIKRYVDDDQPLDSIMPPDGKPDLRKRTYTLGIFYQRFSTLSSLHQFNMENLDIDFYMYIANLVSSTDNNMSTLKKYLQKKEFYSLKELYSQKSKKPGRDLVDYGLNLISGKIVEIMSLTKKIKDIENTSQDRTPISQEINSIFDDEEDLKIALSVCENIKKIKSEKAMYFGIISTIEYMANHTDLLDNENGQKTLTISSKLGSFNKDYIKKKNGLAEKLNEEIAKLNKEIEKKKTKRDQEKIDRDQAIKEGKSNQEIEALSLSVNNMDNDIYWLECNKKKKDMQLRIIRGNLRLLGYIDPDQIKYMVEKIKEYGKKWNIHVEEKPEESMLKKAQAIILSIALLVFLTGAVLFFYSRQAVKVSGVS